MPAQSLPVVAASPRGASSPAPSSQHRRPQHDPLPPRSRMTDPPHRHLSRGGGGDGFRGGGGIGVMSGPSGDACRWAAEAYSSPSSSTAAAAGGHHHQPMGPSAAGLPPPPQSHDLFLRSDDGSARTTMPAPSLTRATPTAHHSNTNTTASITTASNTAAPFPASAGPHHHHHHHHGTASYHWTSPPAPAHDQPNQSNPPAVQATHPHEATANAPSAPPPPPMYWSPASAKLMNHQCMATESPLAWTTTTSTTKQQRRIGGPSPHASTTSPPPGQPMAPPARFHCRIASEPGVVLLVHPNAVASYPPPSPPDALVGSTTSASGGGSEPHLLAAASLNMSTWSTTPPPPPPSSTPPAPTPIHTPHPARNGTPPSHPAAAQRSPGTPLSPSRTGDGGSAVGGGSGLPFVCDAFATHGACPAGSTCPLVHADITRAKRLRPHFRTNAAEAGERLGHPGQLILIARVNERVASITVDAGQCFKTRAVIPRGVAATTASNCGVAVGAPPSRAVRVPSVCAHFIKKFACDYGAECRFVHPLRVLGEATHAFTAARTGGGRENVFSNAADDQSLPLLPAAAAAATAAGFDFVEAAAAAEPTPPPGLSTPPAPPPSASLFRHEHPPTNGRRGPPLYPYPESGRGSRPNAHQKHTNRTSDASVDPGPSPCRHRPHRFVHDPYDTACPGWMPL